MNKKLYDLKELIEKRRASLGNSEGMVSVSPVALDSTEEVEVTPVALDSTEEVEVTPVLSDETSIVLGEPDVPVAIVEPATDTAIVTGDSAESTTESQADNGTKKKRRKK